MDSFDTPKWDLHVEMCPVDVYFNEWIEQSRLKDQTIYHFGTGAHHIVGATQAANGNRVFGITASKEEYERYIELVLKDKQVAANYVCYFGNVYLTNVRLLPMFDIVNLFHLCEFFPPKTNSQTGELDGRALLDAMTAQTKPGGHILFYSKSQDFHTAGPIIEAWAKAGLAERLPDYKTMLVYRKRG
jgi:hypothetical protein